MANLHKVSVAALVTNAEGKILLVNSPWRGWEYPGGLIESGETFEEALHREVREEAGVDTALDLPFAGQGVDSLSHRMGSNDLFNFAAFGV